MSPSDHPVQLSLADVAKSLGRKFTQLEPVVADNAADDAVPSLSQTLFAKVYDGNILAQTCIVSADADQPSGFKKSYIITQYTDNAGATVLAETDGVNANLIGTFMNTIGAIVSAHKGDDLIEKSYAQKYDNTLEESLANTQGLHKMPDDTVKVLVKQKLTR